MIRHPETETSTLVDTKRTLRKVIQPVVIHYPYFICFIAVILNTLYAFYVLCLVALHLFVGK